MPYCGGCASANEWCGNGLEKIYPATAVRFGRMRHIGEFSYPADMKFTCGAKVVVATDRGIELAEQVSLTCFGCDRAVSREKMRAYAEASGGDAYQLKTGRILREATEADLAEWRHLLTGIPDKLETARRIAAELSLQMKLVDCEHIFGGERIVFYFLADERVDFRELVRTLAGEFQTRIEMRQIGARDEARLVADYETCGRECCCKNFLKTLKPVSMQMAKLQKATLDPSKVSGRCGRLKCCLRYEHETYEELDRKLPRMGSRIRTVHGTGQVIDRQVLTQLIKLRMDDDRLLSVPVEDVQETNLPPAPPRPAPDQMENGDNRRRPAERPRGDANGNRPPRNGNNRGPGFAEGRPRPAADSEARSEEPQPPDVSESPEDSAEPGAEAQTAGPPLEPTQETGTRAPGIAGPDATGLQGPRDNSGRLRGGHRRRRRRGDRGHGPRPAGGQETN